jgi:uncharacterized protein YcnI
MNAPRALLAVSVASLVCLAVAAGAWGHAQVSPPVALAKEGQLFTLAVPTEKEDAFTTQVELTPPEGFNIDSFVPAAGWKRQVEQTGSSAEAVITKVTWSGGHVPTEEDAFFQFLASTDSAKTYTFAVRQTYSDGEVVDWSGPESSDTPAPTVEAESSLGGGGAGIVGWIAIVLGGVACVLALVAIVGRRGGGRELA